MTHLEIHAVMPACKDCLHFRVGMYTYLCIAPQIAVKSVDPIDGNERVRGQYPERLREDADKCGPEGRWFEPYPYRLPKITGAPPFLKALIFCAPLFGLVFLGLLLASYHHAILLGLLAFLTLLVTPVLLVMMHERDDPP